MSVNSAQDTWYTEHCPLEDFYTSSDSCQLWAQFPVSLIAISFTLISIYLIANIKMGIWHLPVWWGKICWKLHLWTQVHRCTHKNPYTCCIYTDTPYNHAHCKLLSFSIFLVDCVSVNCYCLRQLQFIVWLLFKKVVFYFYQCVIYVF